MGNDRFPQLPAASNLTLEAVFLDPTKDGLRVWLAQIQNHQREMAANNRTKNVFYLGNDYSTYVECAIESFNEVTIFHTVMVCIVYLLCNHESLQATLAIKDWDFITKLNAKYKLWLTGVDRFGAQYSRDRPDRLDDNHTLFFVWDTMSLYQNWFQPEVKS